MKKLLLILTLLQTILFATSHNIFIIKDKNGKLIKGKRITHSKNAYFNESESEKERKALLAQLNKLSSKKQQHAFMKEQDQI